MSFLASSSHLNLGLPFGLVAYGSPDTITVIKSRTIGEVRHVKRTGQKITAHEILIGKTEEKKNLRINDRIWEDNITCKKSDVTDFTHLA
jgi:hypothetical protein